MARTGSRALSYLRVSGQGQIGGDGFPRQREAVERYAKLHGLEVLQEFRDEGVSGTKELEGRVGRVVDRDAGAGRDHDAVPLMAKSKIWWLLRPAAARRR